MRKPPGRCVGAHSRRARGGGAIGRSPGSGLARRLTRRRPDGVVMLPSSGSPGGGRPPWSYCWSTSVGSSLYRRFSSPCSTSSTPITSVRAGGDLVLLVGEQPDGGRESLVVERGGVGDACVGRRGARCDAARAAARRRAARREPPRPERASGARRRRGSSTAARRAPRGRPRRRGLRAPPGGSRPALHEPAQQGQVLTLGQALVATRPQVLEAQVVEAVDVRGVADAVDAAVRGMLLVVSSRGTSYGGRRRLAGPTADRSPTGRGALSTRRATRSRG